jgi:glycosyltransferase involved in cell wall biosynthesis
MVGLSDAGARPARRALALTWLDHRRTLELCAGLNIELIVYTTRLRGALRYLLLGMRTLLLLLRRRPQVLLVQNPSLVLAALALLLRPVLRYRLVVDAHNEAVHPFTHKQGWLLWLSRKVIRGADLTIVTNRFLAEDITRLGGRPFTLPDRVPSPPAVTGDAAIESLNLRADRFNAVLIATFGSDEPCAEVFAAVTGTDIELYVTGNTRRLNQATAAAAAAAANVHFTGFLEEHAYWSLLRAADAIIDLSLKENCLVCGSYEALALGKPMLLSDSPASRELFGASAVFTDNTVADIRRALERLRAERASLREAADLKRTELTAVWNTAARVLSAAINEEGAKPPAPDGGLVN